MSPISQGNEKTQITMKLLAIHSTQITV